MAQTFPSGLVATLEKAKHQLMEAIQTAGQAGQWDLAEWGVRKAKDLDEMIIVLQNGTGAGHSQFRPMPEAATKFRPAKLPYHYTEANKLVKLGRSRDGGSTYKHRVVREHFDAVINELAEIASETATFETTELVRRCEVPKHEPKIILDVLEEQKLLTKVRRGRWMFTNAETFGVDAQKVWSALPKQ